MSYTVIECHKCFHNDHQQADSQFARKFNGQIQILVDHSLANKAAGDTVFWVKI